MAGVGWMAARPPPSLNVSYPAVSSYCTGLNTFKCFGMGVPLWGPYMKDPVFLGGPY